MFIFVIFFVLIIAVVIYKNKKKPNKMAAFRKNSTVSIDREQFELSGFLGISKPLLHKIDLNMNNPIVSHKNIHLKCIRAGIRESEQQKMMILKRYLFVIPFSVLTLTVGCMVFNLNTIGSLFLCCIAGALLGFFWPVIRLDSMIKNRQEEIDAAFPDFLDLMIVCVGAGMSADQTYVRITDDLRKFSPCMANEINILGAEVTYFLDAKIAYDNLYFRTQNSFVKAFCSVVLQSIKFGTPLSQSLKALSQEVRENQLAKIERKAAALPSKLTVPMIFFTLPVLFAVILYPGISEALKLM